MTHRRNRFKRDKKRREHWIKLNYEKAKTIRKLRNEREWPHADIAARYDISVSHSSNVSHGRFWKE